MISDQSRKWLLLIHQIPPKPDALRVKIWRRLQQVGAVAVKQSVYALPQNDNTREDFSWILREIVEGGGDGSISEARFLEGLTDDKVIAQFQTARRSDYEKLIQDTNQLLADWTTGRFESRETAGKGPPLLSKLKRRLDDISAVDFFGASEKGTVELLLKDLQIRMAGKAPAAAQDSKSIADFKGKVWVTRDNLFVDRIACGWLIRRFVDGDARFRYIKAPQYTPSPGEVRFDMFQGEFTHEGDRCSFEVMIERLGIQDRAMIPVAEIVHDIDLKDAKYGRKETEGFNALLTGLAASYPEDERRMSEGFHLFQNLYAFFQRNKGE